MKELKEYQIQKAKRLASENSNVLTVNILKLKMHIGIITANRILEVLKATC